MRKPLLSVFLGLILILSIFFRVWKLNIVPIELFGDELDVGLQAYSILTTGNDYLGNRLPVMFHSFSEYRYPMQLYMDVPFIFIFGLNQIGVRAVPVLMGLLTLVLTFLLLKHLFNKKVAFIGLIFMAISPWHFNFSRQANDAGILLPFVIGGTLFFIKGMEKYKFLLVSIVLFALSIYTYAISVAFVPLFVLFLLGIYRKNIFTYSLPKLAAAFLLGAVILIPFVKSILSGISSERFSVIAVNSGDSVFQEVVDKRRWSESILTRFFYNTKSITFDRTFTNYLTSFSTDFLFTKGDPNMRQGIEGFGQMYRFDTVLLVLGGFYILFQLTRDKADKKKFYIIMVWLLLAPIPSSLTKDGGNHASRLVLMIPPLITITSLGLNSLLEKARSTRFKIMLGLLIIIMVFEITRFYHRYFVIWSNESSRFWQSGFRETLTFVKNVDPEYSRIIFNNTYEPMLPRFLFYYQYDMRKFQKEFTGDRHMENIVPNVDGFSLGGKYYFGELKKPIEKLADAETLVVASADKDATNPEIFYNGPLKLLKQVDSPVGLPIFYIFTNKTSE